MLFSLSKDNNKLIQTIYFTEIISNSKEIIYKEVSIKDIDDTIILDITRYYR